MVVATAGSFPVTTGAVGDLRGDGCPSRYIRPRRPGADGRGPGGGARYPLGGAWAALVVQPLGHVQLECAVQGDVRPEQGVRPCRSAAVIRCAQSGSPRIRSSRRVL